MNFEYEIIESLSDDEFKELMFMILKKTKLNIEKENKLNKLLTDKIEKENK